MASTPWVMRIADSKGKRYRAGAQAVWNRFQALAPEIALVRDGKGQDRETSRRDETRWHTASDLCAQLGRTGGAHRGAGSHRPG